MSGVLGNLWPFTPNWSRPVRQTWTYRTEVLTARTGREQRSALRTVPRKRVEFTAHVREENRRELGRLMDAYQQVDYVLPDFPRFVTATAEVPATSGQNVPVDSFPDWLTAGILVVLVNRKSVQLRVVDSVNEGGGYIQLGDDSAESFPAGTHVCFGLNGYLNDPIQTRRLTNEVVEIGLNFSTDPGSEDYVAPPAATETFNGREVFIERPNWSDPVSLGHQRPGEFVDFDRGTIERFYPHRVGSRLFRATFLSKSYARAEGILDTFRRARGQRGEFYMPTWENDLPARIPLAAGSAQLRTPGKQTFADYEGHPAMQAVMVYLRDGTRIYREVTGITEVSDSAGEDSILTLSDVWPSNIALEDILMVSWLPCCRFASDAITIEWLTETKSRMQLAIRTLEHLDAE